MGQSANIVIISDTHIGSTVSLCPPVFTLDDGGEYHASRGQRWIWDNWLDFLSRVEQLKQPLLIFNGDMIEADAKRRSYQVITRNPSTLQRLAADILDPLVKMASGLYVIRGTAAHGGKSGNAEEQLAADFGAIHKRGEAYSRYHLPLQIGSLRLDIAHHATMGGAPTARTMAANRLAWQTMLEYQIARETPPDLVIRGHQHRWGDSYDAYPTRAVFSAGWTLATEYIESRSPGNLADIGGLIIRMDGEKWELEKAHYKPRRTWVKMTC